MGPSFCPWRLRLLLPIVAWGSLVPSVVKPSLWLATTTTGTTLCNPFSLTFALPCLRLAASTTSAPLCSTRFTDNGAVPQEYLRPSVRPPVRPPATARPQRLFSPHPKMRTYAQPHVVHPDDGRPNRDIMPPPLNTAAMTAALGSQRASYQLSPSSLYTPKPFPYPSYPPANSSGVVAHTQGSTPPTTSGRPRLPPLRGLFDAHSSSPNGAPNRTFSQLRYDQSKRWRAGVFSPL